MDFSEPTVVVALIAAFASIVGAVLTYRNSRQSNATNERKVDIEEFNAQQARWKMLSDQQDHQLKRVLDQLTRVEQQLDQERNVSDALRREIRHLQDRIDDMVSSTSTRVSLRRVEPPASPA